MKTENKRGPNFGPCGTPDEDVKDKDEKYNLNVGQGKKLPSKCKKSISVVT